MTGSSPVIMHFPRLFCSSRFAVAARAIILVIVASVNAMNPPYLWKDILAY
jgi:hypothetical protein